MAVDGKGERKNDGKLPMHLIPVSSNMSIARVMAVGAAKYSPHNWRRGMSWSIVMGCLERHYNAFKAGQDIDEESGLRHIELLLCNVAFLNEYFYTCPELDDRYKNTPEEAEKMLSPGKKEVIIDSSVTVWYSNKKGVINEQV